MKDIYQFAINFEQENQKFYRDCAARVGDGRLEKVFYRLADEEKKHEQIIRNLAESGEIEPVESDIVSDARETFRELTRDFDTNEGVMPRDQLSIYKKAWELEKKSHTYYSEKAEETEDELIKETFSRLAVEEKKHQNIMHNLVTMVERPKTWLEDAEWYHHQDY